MSFIVATNVIANQPHEHRPTKTRTARAKIIVQKLWKNTGCPMEKSADAQTLSVEIFGNLWKFLDSGKLFGMKICENFSLNIKYLAYL